MIDFTTLIIVIFLTVILTIEAITGGKNDDES